MHTDACELQKERRGQRRQDAQTERQEEDMRRKDRVKFTSDGPRAGSAGRRNKERAMAGKRKIRQWRPGQSCRGCRLTFTASLHLSHGCQGVRQKVGQTAVQIDRCKATLESLAGVDQLREVAVHLFGDAPDVQVTWR